MTVRSCIAWQSALLFLMIWLGKDPYVPIGMVAAVWLVMGMMLLIGHALGPPALPAPAKADAPLPNPIPLTPVETPPSERAA